MPTELVYNFQKHANKYLANRDNLQGSVKDFQTAALDFLDNDIRLKRLIGDEEEIAKRNEFIQNVSNNYGLDYTSSLELYKANKDGKKMGVGQSIWHTLKTEVDPILAIKAGKTLFSGSRLSQHQYGLNMDINDKGSVVYQAMAAEDRYWIDESPSKEEQQESLDAGFPKEVAYMLKPETAKQWYAKGMKLLKAADKYKSSARYHDDLKVVNDYFIHSGGLQAEIDIKGYVEATIAGIDFPTGKIASGVTQSAIMMLELVATNRIGGGLKAEAKLNVKTALQILKSRITVTGAARSLAQATAMPSTWTNAIKAAAPHIKVKDGKLEMKKEGMPYFDALAGSIVDSTITVIAEKSGRTIGQIGGRLLEKFPTGKKLVAALKEGFRKKNPLAGKSGANVTFAKEFFKRAEFHGFVEEALEERLEDVMRFGTGRQENLLPSLEEWAIELGVLGVLKGGQVSLTGAATALEFATKPKPEAVEAIPEVAEEVDYGKAGEAVKAAAAELAATHKATFTYSPDTQLVLADMVKDEKLPAFTEEAAAGLLRSHGLDEDTDLSTVQLVGYTTKGKPIIGTDDEIHIAQGGNVYDVVEEVFESNFKNMRPEAQTDLLQELKAYELVNGQMSEGSGLERLSDLARAAAFDKGLHKKLGFKLKEIVDRIREAIHNTIRHARTLRSQVRAGNVSQKFLQKLENVTYQRAIDKQLGEFVSQLESVGAKVQEGIGTAFQAVQQPGKSTPAAIQPAKPGETPGKYTRWYEKLGVRLESEATGQGILDDLEDQEVNPTQLNKVFWERVYPNLDEVQQRKFERAIESLTGFKPGSVIATNKSGSDVVAKTWADVGRMAIDADRVEYLEGVERGLIVLEVAADLVQQKPGKFEVMGEQRSQSEVENLRQDVEFWKGKAQTDQLTGLKSKDYATGRLPEVLAESSKAGKPVSIVFMDITNFKALNETLGHEKADTALKAVGEVIRDVTRKDRGDELAFSSRYGGDELLLVLPGATAFEADRVVQRIKQGVDKKLREMGMGEVAQEGQIWPIGLNEGIATQQPGETLDASKLIEKADLESQKRRAELNKLYGLPPSARFAKKEQAGDDISAALVRILPPLPKDLKATEFSRSKGLAHQTLKGVREIGSLTSDLISPITTALYKIFPVFFRRLRLFEQDYRLAIKKDLDKVEPFVKKMAKLPENVKSKLDLYLKNGDIYAFQPILEKYGMDKDYLKVQAVLNKIYDDARTTGIDLGYTEIFMPRAIKDLNELRNILAEKHNQKYWSEFETAIRQQERKTGKKLEGKERTNYINQLIRGYGTNRIQITAQGHSKGRVLKTLDSKLNEQYLSSEMALTQYIQQMRESIEARKMFGMGDAEAQVEEAIGSYVHGMVGQQAITPEQEREVVEIFTARFSSKSPRGILRTYRDFQYIDLLTSAAVAIRQLEDLGIAWYRAGILTGFPKVLANFAKAALSKSDIKLVNMGIYNIAAEMTDPSKVKKVLDIGLLAAGFKYLDRVGKETTMNTIIQTYQKQAKKAQRKGVAGKDFRRRIERVFGERADEVIAKMADGTVDPDVQFLAFSELLDVQPIALSEMPKKYLQMSDGKVLYILKSFMLRRLDFVMNETIRTIRVDPVQGIINTFRLVAALTMMGVATDELQDWMLGRRTSLSEEVADNLLRLFGFSRYNINDAHMRGGWKALVSRIVPPFRLIDSAQRDIRDLATGKYTGSESLASIPLIGKILYWRWGKGAKKEKKKQLRERPKTLGSILRKRIGPKPEGVKRTRLRIR